MRRLRFPVVSTYYVSEDIRVRSEKTSSTLADFGSLPRTRKMMITMRFSWAIVIKKWRQISSSAELQCFSTDIDPLPADQDSIVYLNIDQLFDPRSSHRIMDTMARSSSLWLSDTARQRLIVYALEKARETLNSIVPRDHDRLYLDFRVVKKEDDYYPIGHGLDEGGLEEESNDESDYGGLLDHLHELEQYMYECELVDYDYDDEEDYDYDDNGLLMIGTDESSIESLEKKTADGEGSCVVCMEDYSSGIEVTCMPCSHAFHEDCVKKWLRVSHYCPICRFEMPTIYQW